MKKWTAILLATLLASCLIGCSKTPAVDSETPTNTQDVADKVEQSSVADDTTTSDLEPQISEAPTPEEPTAAASGIVGSHYTDITTSLEPLGLTDHPRVTAPEEARSFYWYSFSSSCENAELDTSFDYSLSTDVDYQLTGGTFGASWLANGDNEQFVSAAADYLGFVSTFPYDKNDPDAVKKWVIDTIPTLEDGVSATKTVGDASFELYCAKSNGNVVSLWLDVKKVEP